jgi:hypothetical protein
MGLFSDSAEKDQAIALRSADIVADAWNKYASGAYGFQIFVQPKKVAEVCRQGARLFEKGDVFPPQPGPFKRTAAFIVLGRLIPFFQFSGKPEQLPKLDEQVPWTVRFLALTIPVVLRQLTVSLNGQTHILDEWKGFPSLHYQLEFFAFQRWLDNGAEYEGYFPPETWKQFSFHRQARMVMATALMLESCYYLNGRETTKIQSQVSGCLTNLSPEQELDLIYTYNIENASSSGQK